MDIAAIEKACQLFAKAAEEPEAGHALVVDIYEPEGVGDAYPVVRHIFYGESQKEAHGYYESHMKTDEFMRDCVKKKKWKKVRCKTDKFWK